MTGKSKITGREQCPVCAAQGADNSEDNLAVYSDGHKYCFACGHVEGKHVQERPKIAMPSKVMDTSIPSKCIGARTCNAWDIAEEYVKVQGKGNVGTGTIIYPYYNNLKKLVGLKFRDYEEEKQSGEKSIFYEGESDFFGWHMVSPNHDELIIWEGENDCLNGWQQNSHVANLGLPGVGLAEKLIRKNAMALREFKRIYVCMDNDDDGLTAKMLIASLLPAHMTYDVSLPSKYKDFTEAAQEGQAQEVYRKMMRDAAPFSLEDLITGQELKAQFKDYIKDGKQFEGFSTLYPGFDAMLAGGLHRGEVVLLVGHTGRGKSTFTAAVARNMAKHTKVMWVGTEMYPMQMMRKFVEAELQKQLLWTGGEYTATEEEIDKALDIITEQLVFYNNISGDFDRLEKSMITAIHQHGVEVIFIDVLSDIETNFSEWQVAADVMQRLVSLSQGNPEDRRPPVGIFCCAHTKGNESENIELDDIRGGAAVRQKSTLIVKFEGDVDETIRELTVLKKSRMYDALVMDTTVEFDIHTRTYKQNEESSRTNSRGKAERSGKRVDVRAEKTTNARKLSTGLPRRRLERKTARSEGAG